MWIWACIYEGYIGSSCPVAETLGLRIFDPKQDYNYFISLCEYDCCQLKSCQGYSINNNTFGTFCTLTNTTLAVVTRAHTDTCYLKTGTSFGIYIHKL